MLGPIQGEGEKAGVSPQGGVQARQEKKQEPEVCSYAIVSSQTADKGEEGGGDEHS